jgi:membrane protein
VQLLLESVKGWSKDNVPRLGASLAYYTLFSLAPVMVIVIAVAGYFFGAEAVRGEIVRQVDDLVGKEGGRVLQGLLAGASHRGDGLIATVIGGITFLLGATGAFLELQHALNTIFKVRQAPPKSRILDFLFDRLRSFGIVISLGFLLMVSLVVSAGLAAFSTYLGRSGESLSLIWRVLDIAVPFAVVTLLFALIYKFLPDAELKWKDVWLGALTTAGLFVLGKELIGLYLGQSTLASTYGAVGSVMILLLWVYYTSQIVLLGAEITRVRLRREEGRDPVPTVLAKREADARPSTERDEAQAVPGVAATSETLPSRFPE